ncbi:methyltransferase domain-containing protein [Hahella ganghwensis]|uniref:methyltransferase domain-containing protein n=1 Tax=Hahella ganghwensis TaxID=286420 RepID=UPI00039DF7FE|nr:methyltransferase domain-containing protein [Hahella ganghwensis]
MNKYLSLTGGLILKDTKPCIVVDADSENFAPINNPAYLSVLESFIHERSLEKAFLSLRRLRNCNPTESSLEMLRLSEELTSLHICLGDGQLLVKKGEDYFDLTDSSRESCQVLTSLFYKKSFDQVWTTPLSLDQFKKWVGELTDLGLLSPVVGHLDWGDFNRKSPFCHSFGFSRGTPIDRYYLDKFVSCIRHQVKGVTIEIGGVSDNLQNYGLERVTSFQTVDIEPGEGVNIVGDIHDRSILAPESVDSLIIFNVLEHCHSPWQVAENIRYWLKEGGKCFGMVPNAQRLHNFPGDYWRPLPDGVRHLFKEFSQLELDVYGNPQTVVASFMGVAAKELTANELDATHPEYPVATCFIAIK